MEKWYKKNYVNTRDWIIENLEYLNLTAKETVIVLLIDYLNNSNIEINNEILSNKSNIDLKDIDNILSSLVSKRYLLIKATVKGVVFNLDTLFEIEVAKEELVFNAELFNLFEEEFGRPLSQNEMVKINNWRNNYSNKLIIYALRESSLYQKLSFPYINKILLNWKKEGKTATNIEEEIDVGC
jgi:DNA replication protein